MSSTVLAGKKGPSQWPFTHPPALIPGVPGGVVRLRKKAKWVQINRKQVAVRPEAVRPHGLIQVLNSPVRQVLFMVNVSTSSTCKTWLVSTPSPVCSSDVVLAKGGFSQGQHRKEGHTGVRAPSSQVGWFLIPLDIDLQDLGTRNKNS